MSLGNGDVVGSKLIGVSKVVRSPSQVQPETRSFMPPEIMAQKPQRQLTEELEKLEQAITLTMQEIDHNIAKTHRIVTTSIIPIIERYGKESEAVWEGSKFWKDFFESSANVALNNYQEDDAAFSTQHEVTEATATQHTYGEESTFSTSSPGQYAERTGDFTRDENAPKSNSDDILDDSLLDSLALEGGPTHSTPQRRAGRGDQSTVQRWADIDSPFNNLRKELSSEDYNAPEPPQTDHRLNLTNSDDEEPALPPTTPRTKKPAIFDQDTSEADGQLETQRTPGAGPLLHRLLDKNYRVQVTPRGKPPASRYRNPTTPRSNLFGTTAALDSSPMSSPGEPQLQTQIFTPRPAKTSQTVVAGIAGTDRSTGGGITGASSSAKTAHNYLFEDDSDDDFLLPPGFSPPKTMQFSYPAKLLATPAKEASKRIVQDILNTAGVALDVTNTTLESSPPRPFDSDEDPF